MWRPRGSAGLNERTLFHGTGKAPPDTIVLTLGRYHDRPQYRNRGTVTGTVGVEGANRAVHSMVKESPRERITHTYTHTHTHTHTHTLYVLICPYMSLQDGVMVEQLHWSDFGPHVSDVRIKVLICVFTCVFICVLVCVLKCCLYMRPCMCPYMCPCVCP